VPHRLPAAILIQRNKPHPDKQEAICLDFAAANGLRVKVLCHHWQDCMSLIAAGVISAIITAIHPGDDVEDAITKAGGSLCVARVEQVRVRRDVGQLVVRMHKRGIDTQEISQILQVNSGDVRRSLRRAGIRPRKSSE
jgi:hypothetical protein